LTPSVIKLIVGAVKLRIKHDHFPTKIGDVFSRSRQVEDQLTGPRLGNRLLSLLDGMQQGGFPAQ
jgi:hypothetical protein